MATTCLLSKETKSVEERIMEVKLKSKSEAALALSRQTTMFEEAKIKQLLGGNERTPTESEQLAFRRMLAQQNRESLFYKYMMSCRPPVQNHRNEDKNTVVYMRRMDEPFIFEVSYKKVNFLITSNPRSMDVYVAELLRQEVSAVVRVCQPTYNFGPIRKHGIPCFELCVEDGGYPDRQKEAEWFKILNKYFLEFPGKPIVVHCISGLGRAPVFVCMALMDLGLTCEDAVELIRFKKHGAINNKQMNFLRRYKSRKQLKLENSVHSCIVT